jgi:hypothetical protein
MGFVPVVIAVAILNIVLFTVMEATRLKGNFVQLSNVRVSLTAFRDQARFLLSNHDIWAAISNDSTCNPTLTCIRDRTDCIAALGPPTEWRPVNCLYGFDGTDTDLLPDLIFDSRNANQGFTNAGLPCANYSMQSSDPNCIIRPIVEWRPKCVGPPCVSPAIELQVKFDAGNALVKFNPENTMFRMFTQ